MDIQPSRRAYRFDSLEEKENNKKKTKFSYAEKNNSLSEYCLVKKFPDKRAATYTRIEKAVDFRFINLIVSFFLLVNPKKNKFFLLVHTREALVRRFFCAILHCSSREYCELFLRRRAPRVKSLT